MIKLKEQMLQDTVRPPAHQSDARPNEPLSPAKVVNKAVFGDDSGLFFLISPNFCYFNYYYYYYYFSISPLQRLL